MTGRERHGTPEGQRLVRRAGLYAWTFLLVAAIVVAGGSAAVAWLMTRAGLPFLGTWLVLMVLVLLPSLLMLVWRAVKERSRRT